MKKKIITVLLIFLVSCSFASAQCKIWTKSTHYGRVFTRQMERLYPEEIVAMNRGYKKILGTAAGHMISISQTSFPSNKIVFSIGFMINDKGEYFIMGDCFAKPSIYNAYRINIMFKITNETPMSFILIDGTEITLYPPSDYKIKNYRYYPYYKISKEQIEKLATIDIKAVKLYFNHHENLESSLEDKLGKHFYFNVEGVSEDILEFASCILTYKEKK